MRVSLATPVKAVAGRRKSLRVTADKGSPKVPLVQVSRSSVLDEVKSRAAASGDTVAESTPHPAWVAVPITQCPGTGTGKGHSVCAYQSIGDRKTQEVCPSKKLFQQVVGHLGDSRIILAKEEEGRAGELSGVAHSFAVVCSIDLACHEGEQLTMDHKLRPDLDGERRRIEPKPYREGIARHSRHDMVCIIPAPPRDALYPTRATHELYVQELEAYLITVATYPHAFQKKVERRRGPAWE
ncbi:hypothetical protein AK812_SmicGene143 [Symbiodinium microadriaticum]|uniref:Uncharacterized protein n=1 Tax=Symbiodinium microadriaticum TaxID=2951 RepID=A0A1Q9F7L3_SYMMI|nr:hypothetical protein AK812_SmicGene143 [Symbiodinium microadriaticum]